MKCLFIRLSSIGDIILTSPLLRCMKSQMPEIEIHFLLKKQFLQTVGHNPYIDQVHLFEDDLSHTIAVLKSEQFDYVIDLHNNWRSWRICRALSVPYQKFNKINFKKFLLTSSLKINKLPDQHIVDRYLETLSNFNIIYDGKGLDFFIPENEEIDLEANYPSLKKNNPYIALVVGAQHATKCMEKEQLVKLCQQINKPIILLGGKKESSIGQFISDQVGEQVYNACGTYNLFGSASLIKQCEKVITPDTGLMHISAALNKPIAVIWGNTVKDFGMYPFMPNGKQLQLQYKSFEVSGLPCRPCSKIGYNKCPKKHFFCMKEQDLAAIAAWADQPL